MKIDQPGQSQHLSLVNQSLVDQEVNMKAGTDIYSKDYFTKQTSRDEINKYFLDNIQIINSLKKTPNDS